MNDTPKGCEGCLLYAEFKGTCEIILRGEQERCPCLECLVKVTCYDLCQKFSEMSKRCIDIKIEAEIEGSELYYTEDE